MPVSIGNGIDAAAAAVVDDAAVVAETVVGDSCARAQRVLLPDAWLMPPNWHHRRRCLRRHRRSRGRLSSLVSPH